MEDVIETSEPEVTPETPVEQPVEAPVEPTPEVPEVTAQ